MAKQVRPVTHKPRRAPGRPHAATAPDTREAIITAARRLLETRVPAQVTNSMIAREAGADPALIRYYFGDRASLLMAVVEQLMASVRATRPTELTTVEQFLRWRISSTLQLSRTTRSMQRIMIDELAESKSAKVRAAVQQGNRQAIQYVLGALQSQMGNEIIDVDPLFLHIAMVGVCEFFTSAQSVVRPLADPQIDTATLASEYEDFVCDLFLNGLRRR